MRGSRQAGERGSLVSLCFVQGCAKPCEGRSYWPWLGAHGQASELMQQVVEAVGVLACQ